MPKRANPFGSDYSPLQMKMHVTQREVNMGVNKEVNMKAVYDRTRELLYSGQQSLHEDPQEVEMEDCKEVQSTGQRTPQNGASPLKATSPPSWFHNQLKLNTAGRLVYGTYPPQKDATQATSKILCSSCSSPHVPVHFICAFCGKNLCYSCRQTCVNCEDGFCSKCCTINYDERCDRIFCLNCTY